jgi:hypothetical protein
MKSDPAVGYCVIACDKREAFAQGSVATKQSILSGSPLSGLLREVYHRARIRATRWLATEKGILWFVAGTGPAVQGQARRALIIRD